MKKSELNILKSEIVKAVRDMPYGDYTRTAAIAHKLRPDDDLGIEDLFELEDAVMALDASNEMVIDKLDHFHKVEGLPFNLGFYKFKNKGLPDGGCSEIDFSLIEGNFRDVTEGMIDLRTGRIVIDDMKKDCGLIISEISEKDRKSLAKSFLIKDFAEDSKELKVGDYEIADGIKWEVSIYDENYEPKIIYGLVDDIADIPMSGAKKLFNVVNKINKR